MHSCFSVFDQISLCLKQKDNEDDLLLIKLLQFPFASTRLRLRTWRNIVPLFNGHGLPAARSYVLQLQLLGESALMNSRKIFWVEQAVGLGCKKNPMGAQCYSQQEVPAVNVMLSV